MFKKSTLTMAVLLAASQLTACSSDDDDDTTPTTQNAAPTAIQLSATTVNENALGVMIGDLSATDTDSGDTFTFTTSDERFVISGSELSLAENVSFDFEKETSTTFSVTVTDSANNTFSQDVTLSVTDTHVNLDDVTATYDFGDSVSYSGQVARHLLILELTNYIGSGLQEDLDADKFDTRQDVLDALMALYKTTDEGYETELGQRALTVSTLVEAKQKTLSEISSSKKDLSGKIAGNDEKGQHKDWSAEFVAFGDKGSMSPEALIEHFLGKIADNAEKFIMGETRTDVLGGDIAKVYLDSNGLDYKQLVQKVLLGAVTFSQGADDYLDDDTEGKGLLADHTALKDGKNYTNLEHQYDEGFGYFGAAVNYLAYNDNEISSKVASDEDGRADWNGNHDTNGDGEIDLTSEYNWGQSVNAAKRDRGTASNTNPTDLTQTTMQAFLEGRKIINDNAGMALTDDQMAALLEQRDIAVDGWERAIAATVVHYINDTRADLANLGTADFNYEDTAKHYSEMKGFALGFQFSPFSKISDEDFQKIHDLMGNKPELDAAKVDAYRADLLEARDIIQAALSFDAENVENW